MTADAKLVAFEALLAEVSGALADTVELLQQKAGASEEVSATLSEIAETLAKTAEAGAAKDPGAALQGLVQAIQGLRIESAAPVVNVGQAVVNNEIHVSPTPIENKIVVEPAAVVLAPPRGYELTGVKYDNAGRLVGARVLPLATVKGGA